MLYTWFGVEVSGLVSQDFHNGFRIRGFSGFHAVHATWLQMSLKDRWGLGLSGLRVEGHLLPAEEIVKLDVG